MIAVIVRFVMCMSFVYAKCPFSETRHLSTEDSAWLGQIPAATNVNDSYVVVNNEFHTQYNETLQIIFPATYLILEGDYLVLYEAGVRHVEAVTPEIYHNLKAISHMPVAVFSLLLSNTSHSAILDTDTISRLTLYYEMLLNVTISESKFPGDPDQLERNSRIFNATRDFVANAISSGQCTSNDVSDFLWSQNSDINENLNDAASAQTNLLHSVVMNYKSMLTDDQWNEMQTAVTASHMAVEDELVAQYFGRLFDVDQWFNEKFCIFSNVEDEGTIRSLVGTHIIDYAIGDGLFHDPYKMHIDVLADGATMALDVIFGPEPSDDDDDDGSHHINYQLQMSFIVIGSMISGALLVYGVEIFFARLKKQKAAREHYDKLDF